MAFTGICYLPLPGEEGNIEIYSIRKLLLFLSYRPPEQSIQHHQS